MEEGSFASCKMFTNICKLSVKSLQNLVNYFLVFQRQHFSDHEVDECRRFGIHTVVS